MLFVSASLLCVTAYDRCRTVRPFMIRPTILVYCSRSSIRFSNSVIFTSFSVRRLFSSALSRWRSVTIACFRHFDYSLALQRSFEQLCKVFIVFKHHFRRRTSGFPLGHCYALTHFKHTVSRNYPVVSSGTIQP